MGFNCCSIYYECFDIDTTRRFSGSKAYELHGPSNRKFYKTSLILQIVSCFVGIGMFAFGLAAIVSDNAYNDSIIEQTNEALTDNSDALQHAFGGVEQYRAGMWRASLYYSVFVASGGLWCFVYITHIICFIYYNNYLSRVIWTAGLHIMGFVFCIIWIVLITIQRKETTNHIKGISEKLERHAREFGAKFTELLYIQDKQRSLFYYCDSSRLPSEKTVALINQYHLCPTTSQRIAAIVFLFLELLTTCLVVIISLYWRRSAKRIFETDRDSEVSSSVSSYSGSFSEGSSSYGSSDNIKYKFSVASNDSSKPVNVTRLNERR